MLARGGVVDELCTLCDTAGGGFECIGEGGEVRLTDDEVKTLGGEPFGVVDVFEYGA